jgi:predicted RNA-binding Zn-ribbon protein involved in translation (DUF1610 family)
MTKVISLNVVCPHCSKSLMDEGKLINNKPSIRAEIVTSIKQKGFLWLSSIYGDFNSLSEFPIQEGNVVEFFCPHCHESLRRKKIDCDACGAPIATLNCDVGGRVSFCTRSGCRNHYVVFEDLDTTIRKFYEEYGYH